MGSLILRLAVLIGIVFSGYLIAAPEDKSPLSILPVSVAGMPAYRLQIPNGAKALLYLPKAYQEANPHTLAIGLHGRSELAETFLKIWIPIADRFDMMLLCPEGSDLVEGYRRVPYDDRKDIIEFTRLVMKLYRIDQTQNKVFGFSKGGSIATELGILEPELFPNVVCMFGFFNKNMPYCNRYSHSKMYFITGKNDVTYASLMQGVDFLKNYGIQTKIKLFSSLVHTYPPRLESEVEDIIWWFSQHPSSFKEDPYAIH